MFELTAAGTEKVLHSFNYCLGESSTRRPKSAQPIGCGGAHRTVLFQTSTATPSGGYAFVVRGTNVVRSLPVAFGGIFNIDQPPSTISGAGSFVDQV
ncbi:MAG: hypothetical protein WBQ72_17370 [Terriglobales bacterium]